MVTLSHTRIIQTVGNVCFVNFAVFAWLWKNILGQNNFQAQDIPNTIKDIAKCAGN